MELSRSGRGTCDGASARGDTFGQRAPLDRVFRRLDGREGTCLRTHGKGEGPFRFWIAYLRAIETPAPVGPAPRRSPLRENRPSPRPEIITVCSPIPHARLRGSATRVRVPRPATRAVTAS